MQLHRHLRDVPFDPLLWDDGWRDKLKRIATVPVSQGIGTSVVAASGTAAPSWPTHATDDIALLLVNQGNVASTDPGAATLSTPAGFTAVTGASTLGTTGTRRTRMTVFWARATSSSMSAPTVAAVTGNAIRAIILTFRGCINTGDPTEAISTGNGASTSVSIPGSTTLGADRLVVCCVGSNSSTVTASGWADTDLTAVTEIVDVGDANQVNIHAATGAKSLAGIYGAFTTTLSSTTAYAGVNIALVPPFNTGGTLLLMGVG